MDNEISILLVDDHAIVRNGIKAMLSYLNRILKSSVKVRMAMKPFQ